MRIILVAIFTLLLFASCTPTHDGNALNTIRTELGKSMMKDYAISLSLDTIKIVRCKDMITYLSAVNHVDLARHEVIDSMYKAYDAQWRKAANAGSSGTQLMLRDMDRYDWLANAKPDDICYVLYKYDLDVADNTYPTTAGLPVGIYYFFDGTGAELGFSSVQTSGLGAIDTTHMDSLRAYETFFQRCRTDTKEYKWHWKW